MIEVVTGGNASGKSVYLRQVALIVTMALAGSYVPAEYAQIGALDRIHCLLSSQESVSDQQSAFYKHLLHVARSFATCGPNSLVVLDEIGKGTRDGGVVAASVIEGFAARQGGCPLVVASSHFVHAINKLKDVVPARARYEVTR